MRPPLANVSSFALSLRPVRAMREPSRTSTEACLRALSSTSTDSRSPIEMIVVSSPWKAPQRTPTADVECDKPICLDLLQIAMSAGSKIHRR
jgi:hypothetical protein